MLNKVFFKPLSFQGNQPRIQQNSSLHLNQLKSDTVSFSGTIDNEKLDENGRTTVENKMLEQRNAIIGTWENPKDIDSFLMLESCKGNFINSRVLPQSGENKDLMVESTKTYGNLDEILNKFEIPEDITVYRGLNFRDYRTNDSSVNSFFEKHYKNGKITKMPLYMNTSFDKEHAKKFIRNENDYFLLKLDVPKGANGAYMEELAPGDRDCFGNERELLLPRNSTVQWGELKQEMINGKKTFVLEGKLIK